MSAEVCERPATEVWNARVQANLDADGTKRQVMHARRKSLGEQHHVSAASG